VTGIECTSEICYSSTRDCEDLYSSLSNIGFRFNNTLWSMKPESYLIADFNSTIQCIVPVSRIAEDEDYSVRLGSVFMRNFFTVLDFDTK